MSSQRSRATPFLKWAGGKQRLLTQFEPFFPETIDTYLEPFLGGGAVFFYIYQHFQPSRVILSDLNEELINCYEVVRDDVHPLIERLQHHKENHSREYYYRVRGMQVADLSPLERAARLIFLNKTCFNGLYRVNSKGKFNVPFGKYKNPPICDQDNLIAVSEILQNVEIHLRDFGDCVQDAGERCFVYLDPPYHPLSVTANFTSYTRHPFAIEEQQRLARVFADLTAQGAYVMESNSDCAEIRSLYQDYRLETVQASRAINSRGDRRGPISELLILNY